MIFNHDYSENDYCDVTRYLLGKPYFTDLYGYNVNWTNRNDGWTEENRKKFLAYNEKVLKGKCTYIFGKLTCTNRNSFLFKFGRSWNCLM